MHEIPLNTAEIVPARHRNGQIQSITSDDATYQAAFVLVQRIDATFGYLDKVNRFVPFRHLSTEWRTKAGRQLHSTGEVVNAILAGKLAWEGNKQC